jgi:hypothetical protein
MARRVCILSALSFFLLVQIQAQNYFENYPTCAQQYLNDAFPGECNTDDLNTGDECLCYNTDYFIPNSMLSIVVNCGCDIVWATAYIVVTFCDEYAGGSSMDEGQMITAGNSGTSTCSTSTPTPTTTMTGASPASSTTTPTPQSGQNSHGLSANWKLTLALGLPGAILSCIQTIGWITTRRFFWMFANCCGRDEKAPKYQTSYQSPYSYRMSSARQKRRSIQARNRVERGYAYHAASRSYAQMPRPRCQCSKCFMSQR